MTVHIYNCPECGHVFTFAHADCAAYADECPACGCVEPDLVDMFEGPEGDD